MRKDIKFCKTCHNISDEEICSICSDKSRDHSTICVVEDLRDVMAIESTEQYNGVFHVLNGLISPMDGIGPDNLNINSLIRRINEDEVKEVIFALSTTMEGDTTIFYISRQMKGTDIKLSSIARGVSIGGELEYTDEVTLARSIAERIPYSQ